jgi:hypothetical protein
VIALPIGLIKEVQVVAEVQVAQNNGQAVHEELLFK